MALSCSLLSSLLSSGSRDKSNCRLTAVLLFRDTGSVAAVRHRQTPLPGGDSPPCFWLTVPGPFRWLGTRPGRWLS